MMVETSKERAARLLEEEFPIGCRVRLVDVKDLPSSCMAGCQAYRRGNTGVVEDHEWDFDPDGYIPQLSVKFDSDEDTLTAYCLDASRFERINTT